MGLGGIEENVNGVSKVVQVSLFMKTNGQISDRKNEQFAQIMHNNNFHWATVSSNLHSRHRTIDYYSFHGQIRDYTKMQILTNNLQLQTFALMPARNKYT